MAGFSIFNINPAAIIPNNIIAIINHICLLSFMVFPLSLYGLIFFEYLPQQGEP